MHIERGFVGRANPARFLGGAGTVRDGIFQDALTCSIIPHGLYVLSFLELPLPMMPLLMSKRSSEPPPPPPSPPPSVPLSCTLSLPFSQLEPDRRQLSHNHRLLRYRRSWLRPPLLPDQRRERNRGQVHPDGGVLDNSPPPLRPPLSPMGSPCLNPERRAAVRACSTPSPLTAISPFCPLRDPPWGGAASSEPAASWPQGGRSPTTRCGLETRQSLSVK